jgi:sulfur-oxidizing protein SoxY
MTKIKMRKTADVTIVAKGKDGKLYSAVQKVEVSIGGCGG